MLGFEYYKDMIKGKTDLEAIRAIQAEVDQLTQSLTKPDETTDSNDVIEEIECLVQLQLFARVRVLEDVLSKVTAKLNEMGVKP
jgi:hypothetical protein